MPCCDIFFFILYGSEVWYQNRKQIKVLDGLHLESLRMVMGCSKVSPNTSFWLRHFTTIVKNRAVTYARSQPDFTLAYRVPDKENEEEREIWERALFTKLFHEFQHVRAVAFDQMWRWRTFVLQFRKDRGILRKTTGGQTHAKSKCRRAVSTTTLVAGSTEHLLFMLSLADDALRDFFSIRDGLGKK